MTRPLYIVIKEVVQLIKDSEGITKTKIASIIRIELYKTDRILEALIKEKIIKKVGIKYYEHK